MSGDIENDRTISTNKVYPIDLAPQKITIVKSVANSEMKMSHLIPGQMKGSTAGQVITHGGNMSLMRSTQIISQGVASQPQMIVTGSPVLQGTQIVSQGSQIMGQSSQIISQTSQLIGPSPQILNSTTQIISQGNQLSGQSSVSNIANVGNTPVSNVPSAISAGTQVISVGGQLVTGSGNLVVGSSLRPLPPSVRVLPPLPHHNTRPMLSSVSVTGSVSGVSSVVVSKPGLSSHVPRGPAAGASLAVPRAAARPISPASTSLPISTLGGVWSGSSRNSVRGALVYSARAAVPRAPPPRCAVPTSPSLATHPTSSIPPLSAPTAPPPPSAIITLPSTTVLTSGVRAAAPRLSAPLTTRPLPLLQRNYQSAKVLGVAGVGVRTPVGNSAPSQLYYEVTRPPAPHSAPPVHTGQLTTRPISPAPHAASPAPTPRSLNSYNQTIPLNNQVSIANSVPPLSEARMPSVSTPSTPLLPRPTILRKREIDGSPSKTAGVGPPSYESMRTEDIPSMWENDREELRDKDGDDETERGGDGGGSTTVSAASSPTLDDDLPSPPRAPSPQDISPRKKPRKQMLSNDIRRCEFLPEDTPSSPPVPSHPPPKRPLLSSSYVYEWRATALHFTRPSDVRRREPRARDIVSLANQKHALTSADGWKVHHLTAQMDDLVSLESDVGEQLATILRTLESVHGKAQAALEPHTHALMELIKGNIQRSRIVCEGIEEARTDILRVFTHRTFVADILSRQADKRCFRKHRSQS